MFFDEENRSFLDDGNHMGPDFGEDAAEKSSCFGGLFSWLKFFSYICLAIIVAAVILLTTPGFCLACMAGGVIIGMGYGWRRMKSWAVGLILTILVGAKALGLVVALLVHTKHQFWFDLAWGSILLAISLAIAYFFAHLQTRKESHQMC